MKLWGSRRRTILWRGSLLPAVAGVASLAPPDARAQDAVSYEVREELSGALLPVHDYDVHGMCATGTGVAPASIYAQGGSGRGEGLGPGLGGRLIYEHAARPLGEAGSTWWGFRMALGMDLDFLYARVDTGIPDMSGKLCARVKSDGAEVQYRGSSVLFLQFPAFVGAEMALRSTVDEDGSGHAVLVAAGWAPAMTYIKPWIASSSFDASFLGTELTLDFATWRQGFDQQQRKRAAIFLLLPPEDHGTVVITLSFGAVWR
jgi:hypothetical protein